MPLIRHVNVFLSLFLMTCLTTPSRSLPQKIPEEEVLDIPEACWIAGYGRGVGKLPGCSGNVDYDAGLCYPKCREGMKGVGPVCWANNGSYGRGVGTIPNGCSGERPAYDAGLCYPKCADGYAGVGPVCWNFPRSYGRGAGQIPNGCPSDKELQHGLCYAPCEKGFNGVGPVCWSDSISYGRGVGKIPRSCSEDHEMDAGLCYRHCSTAFSGIGPVCWQDKCDRYLPYKCGPICVRHELQCAAIWSSLGAKGVIKVATSKAVVDGLVLALLDTGLKFASWPTCRSVFEKYRDYPDRPLTDEDYHSGTGIAKEPLLEPPNACFLGNYGRGVGKLPGCKDSQDYDAGLCYPKCNAGTRGVGPVCWGLGNTYGRGVGTLPFACPDSQDYDAGLCYPKCSKGHNGIGPMCWQKKCPDFLPFKCGAICTASEIKCAELIASVAPSSDSPSVSGEDALDAAIDALTQMAAFPTCHQVDLLFGDSLTAPPQELLETKQERSLVASERRKLEISIASVGTAAAKPPRRLDG